MLQEIIRIQRNTSESLREEKRVEHLTKFAWKLKNSGYDKRERKEIILAGMKGFKRLEELDRRGVRSINRSRKENYNLRQLKKHRAKTGWYKKGEEKEKLGEQNSRPEISRGGGSFGRMIQEKEKIEAVMFVPATPGGELCKLLQEGDDRAREGTNQRRVKFVERGGRPSGICYA